MEPSTLHEIFSLKFWYIGSRGYAQLVEDATLTPFYPAEDLRRNKPWRSTWWIMTIPTVLQSGAYMTIEFVLRYYLLMQTLGIQRHHVVLIIGLTDALVGLALALPRWTNGASTLQQWIERLQDKHAIPSIDDPDDDVTNGDSTNITTKTAPTRSLSSKRHEWWWWGPLAWYIAGLSIVVGLAAFYLACPVYRTGPRLGCHYRALAVGCFIVGTYAMRYAHARTELLTNTTILRKRVIKTLQVYHATHREGAGEALQMMPKPPAWWNRAFGGKQPDTDAENGAPAVKDYGFMRIHDRIAEQLTLRVQRYDRMVYFAVLAVAPYTAVVAVLLTKYRYTQSYLCMGIFFLGFIIMLATVVHDLRVATTKQEALDKADGKKSRSRSKKKKQQPSYHYHEGEDEEEIIFHVHWVELFPKWCVPAAWHKPETNKTANQDGAGPTETDPLTGSTASQVMPIHQVERYSKAFCNLGLFQFFLEIVRGPAVRVVALRTLDYHLSTTKLAEILTLFGITYFLTMWASEVSVANRRLATFLSVTLFGVGLASMGLSLHANGIHAAAIAFGMAEAVCTGLRELVEQDYLAANGPLGELSTAVEAARGVSAREIRQEVVYKTTQVWQWTTEIVVSVILGVVGYLLSVRHVALVFGALSLGSIVFSLWFMKPTRSEFVHSTRNLLGAIQHDMKYNDYSYQ